MDECMDAWMDGWMHACMHGWIDGWMHACMDWWMDELTNKWMDWWMDELTNKWMHWWMDRWIDELMDGWMVRWWRACGRCVIYHLFADSLTRMLWCDVMLNCIILPSSAVKWRCHSNFPFNLKINNYINYDDNDYYAELTPSLSHPHFI